MSAQTNYEVDSAELAKKRQGYYDQWRSLGKEMEATTKAEEEAEKLAGQAKLGLNNDAPKSEAEQRDREKREALREAKKQWEGRKTREEEMTFVLTGLEGVDKVLQKDDIEHRPVLRITNCKDCKLELSENVDNMIKVFVDDCEGTTLTLKSHLVTQHLEISHSSEMKLVVGIPTMTVQLDLIDGIEVTYLENVLLPEHKLYHAGVKRLSVLHRDSQSIEHDYTVLEEEDDEPAEERQYVTHIKDGHLTSERVYRASGMMPLTDEELSKVAGTQEIDNAKVRQAKEKKTAGNEAFASGEHMQAGVFYTQAIDLAPNDHELVCVCLANRAACNLKLGRLEEAHDDAVACVTLNPKYTKGWFRKGIALHAMKKYGPAIEALSEADKLEPKNKQISEAIGFAKVLLDKQMRELQSQLGS